MELSNVFFSVLFFQSVAGTHIHWKPQAFCRSREGGAPAADPHGKKRRNPVVSPAYLGFHWLEFLLGWPLRIHPIIFRGGLAVIERFYYGFFVDQQRYRLWVSRVTIRCGYWLLPNPNRVFVLDAPAEELRRRKREVARGNGGQRGAYMELVNPPGNGLVIAASRNSLKRLLLT